MNIKIRKFDVFGVKREETLAEIKEVVLNEDFMRLGGETISLCFKGKGRTGIVVLTTKEAGMIIERLKSRDKLIKGAQVFRVKKGEGI